MGARSRVLGVFLGALAIPASSSGAPLAMPRLDDGCDIRDVEIRVQGEPAPITTIRPGEELEVSFVVPPGCANRLTLGSFVAPQPAFDGSRLDDQVPYARTTDVYPPGRHSVTVTVFPFAPVNASDCAAARDQAQEARDELAQAVRDAAARDPEVRERIQTQAQQDAPPQQAAPSNVVGPIDVPCGAANGRPCDGCVGNADDKDPPGQDRPDPNAGYECDRNLGIGRGNPAHTGCPNFQLDLAYRPTVQPATDLAMHPEELAIGLFCVRTSGECYVTDNTRGQQVARSLPGEGSR
jgi:hypothetical protein